jgi:oligoendopeptidase F
MAKERNQIEESQTWDLSTIFPTDKDWENELKSLNKALDNIAQYEGHLIDKAGNLLEITELELALSRRIEKLYVYASMKNDQDTREAKYQEYQSKAATLYAGFSQAFAFYQPEFLELSQEQYEQFLAEEPRLKEYAHSFERLFAHKPYVLSKKEEELLAGASEIFGAASDTFEIFDNADIKLPIVTDESGSQIQLTHGNYISLMESKDREVRKSAYESLYSNYEQYQHTYAKTLETNVKVHNFRAKTRGYDSARQAALSGNFIPDQVYDKLLNAVHKHLPLLQRYIHLRKEILKIEELRMYDIYTPLSNLDYKFTYEQAVEKAQQVLSILGEDYSKRVQAAFSERWIDVEENIGKRSGAYSGGAYDTNAFMLLNWQNTLDNLFTLVHEMGHSMHSTFTRENQPYVYGDYSIFLAEIASTTNENILTETLLNEARDDKEKFAILNHWLDGFRGTIFRQTQFAEFEAEIHKADASGTVLTSEYMNKLYADINEKYYGLSAEANPQIQYEWARIPHFYYNFYVFQYATGFAAASYLANKVVHGTDEDKEKYLDYLKAGNSDYPLEVIKKAGVDMLNEDYLNQAFAIFEERLTMLEELVKKGVAD